MKDVALHKLSGMGKEKAIVDPISGKTANRMVYDTQLSLNVPQGENVLRGLLVNMENADAFTARLNKHLAKLQNHFFRIEKVEGVHKVVLMDVVQPAWFVKQLDGKINRMGAELKAAQEMKELAERLEKVTAKATKARVVAERATQTADPEATLLVRKADRLDVDKKVLEMKMQVADLDTKIAQKTQKVVRSPEDEEKIKALEVQRAAAEKAVERYVKETRAKADLGILSNEAAALERKVEYSTSPSSGQKRRRNLPSWKPTAKPSSGKPSMMRRSRSVWQNCALRWQSTPRIICCENVLKICLPLKTGSDGRWRMLSGLGIAVPLPHPRHGCHGRCVE